MGFDRFIRFIDEHGETVYGNLPEEIALSQIEGSQVEVLAGGPLSGFQKTDEQKTVKKASLYCRSIILSIAYYVNDSCLNQSCYVL